MKFGDTLYQRSIPQWSINNIDYDELKHSIKVLTTKDASRARPIPNSGYEARQEQASQDRLFTDLENQHDRVNDFVQVKAGELSRRLTDLDKQIQRLSNEYASRKRPGLAGKWAERFSRLDAILQKIGEEVQSLSRFARTNSLAIQKLLKKYSKWTGSHALGERFRRSVMDRPSSLSRQNFGLLVAQYQDNLDALRTAHYAASRPGRVPSGQRGQAAREGQDKFHVDGKRRSSAAIIHNISQNEASLALDGALAITPLGEGGTRATYWVHQDNITNVQIMILRHASQRKADDRASMGSTRSSSRSSPKCVNDCAPRPRGNEDACNYSLIVCDDPGRFAKQENSETISDFEKLPGSCSERATASIRLSKSEEVFVAINIGPDEAAGNLETRTSGNFLQSKLSRKNLRDIGELKAREKTNVLSSGELSYFANWRFNHPEVKPLVQISSYRDQYEGLENSDKGGIWVTIDNGVLIRSCSESLLVKEKPCLTVSGASLEGAQHFPHAVLELRVEGNGSTQLIEALDQSHLVERVRGFSLETHAVARVCRPPGMPPPYWIPLLDKDIRKVPVLAPQPKERGAKSRISEEQASTQDTSLSTPSTNNGFSSSGFSAAREESSITSAPDISDSQDLPKSIPQQKKRRRSREQKKPLQRSLGHNALPQPRYWNEFDDGSDGEQQGDYVIYVDPTAPSGFPGAILASKLFNSLSEKAKASKDKVTAWMHPSRDRDVEDGPLFTDSHHSLEDSDLSDDETSTIVPDRRRYSTFPAPQKRPPCDPRETVLVRSYISAFAASVILLFLAIILLYTRRRKGAIEVDIGVVVGVSTALVFALVGLASMIARRSHVGWIHRTLVLLICLCVLVVSITLLVATGERLR